MLLNVSRLPLDRFLTVKDFFFKCHHFLSFIFSQHKCPQLWPVCEFMMEVRDQLNLICYNVLRLSIVFYSQLEEA